MPDAQGKPTDAELREQIRDALFADAKVKPAAIEALEILRDPDGNPLGYRDPGTGSYYPIPAGRAAPTPTSQLDRLDINGRVIPPEDTTTRVVKLRDPRTGATTDYPDPTAAAAAATPTAQLDRIDAKGKVIPPEDTTTPAVKLRDPVKGTTVDLPDAKTSPDGTVKEFGNRLLNIKPDGTFTVITEKSADATAQTKSTFDGPDGARYEYDPNKAEGQRLNKLIDAPPDKTKPQTEVRNGVTYEFDPAVRAWKEAAGLPSEERPKTMTGAGTTSPYLIRYDAKSGEEIGREPNPNYRPPPATLPAQNANAPMVPIEDPDKPGTIKWVPNEGRVMAPQALSQLAAQLTKTVVDPNNPLTLDQAKTIIDAANAQMTTEAQQAATAAGAAQNILTTTQQGAQTGGGMLAARSTATQNLVQQGLNVGNLSQSSDGIGGGLQAPVPGLGANLVQGAAGFATELGGGQSVYDTAARLVQAADPKGGSPLAQQAQGMLAGMLGRYEQLFGQKHPAVAATEAAGASQQNSGFVPPPTAPAVAPVAPVASPNLFHATPIITTPQGANQWSYQFPGVTVPQAGFTAPDMFSQAGVGGMGYR